MSQEVPRGGGGEQGARAAGTTALDTTSSSSNSAMASHQQQHEPLPELLETVRCKVTRTTGERSPRAYQKIEISSPDEEDHQQQQRRNVSLRSANSMSSMASAGGKTRKFACQFDPSVKNGRALVLKFDEHGVGAFQEITRLELLRLTQEAAKPSVNLAAGEDDAAADVLSDDERGPTRRVKARKTALRRPHADPGDKNAPYATICDVQVRVEVALLMIR